MACYKSILRLNPIEDKAVSDDIDVFHVSGERIICALAYYESGAFSILHFSYPEIVSKENKYILYDMWLRCFSYHKYSGWVVAVFKLSLICETGNHMALHMLYQITTFWDYAMDQHSYLSCCRRYIACR